MILRCDLVSRFTYELKPVFLHFVWQFALCGPDHQSILDDSSASKFSEVVQGLLVVRVGIHVSQSARLALASWMSLVTCSRCLEHMGLS